MTTLRLSLFGRVCAGDFLKQGESGSDYLISQGLFLKFALFGIISILILTGSAVLIGVLCSKK